MSIRSHRDELLRAARESGVLHRLLPDAEAAEVWVRIGQTYFPRERSLMERRFLFLWERLDYQAAVRTSLGWQYIGEFVGPRPALVLFNPAYDLGIIAFDTGNDLTLAIGESFGFEFYVTDAQATYLLCFNHHDFLIGSGTAVTWIETLASRLESESATPDPAEIQAPYSPENSKKR
jgi:hypothetical protein